MADAAALGLADGDAAQVTTRSGSAVATVEVTDTLQAGHASLPNGFGVGEPGDSVGVAPSELTSAADLPARRPRRHAGSRKHVPARIERAEPQPA